MLNISITLRDVALNIGRDFTISLDEQLPVRELIALLVNKIGWPQKDISGQMVQYAMIVDRNKILLTGDEMIKAVGLLNGDIIILGPIVGGPYATGHAFQQPGQPRPQPPIQPSQPSQPSQPTQPTQPTQPQSPYTMAPLKRDQR